ncbi:hypothetical protein TRFO_31995 [Tritrichomonas foetus]|uniref:Uncharacterized protein n=1 Tax=Tritrichomonas foetus TaxID=1144522 RepID=A0A1J4JQ11_9EUKA|nr:hypothetical protein TRFO_31995 [Tritrichomonas foetus]|eukprot:OHT01247.1 hypothetical protein TRFO_31995 [Tritrichomonas foetus]
MLSIHGLYEVHGRNLVMEREKQIKEGIIDLGPDDLVSLTKEESGFFIGTRSSFFYHHICGIPIESLATFPAYFSDLLFHKNKSLENSNIRDYKITKGRLFVYNSFSKCDVVITVSNPGGCEASTTNSKGEKIRIDQVKMVKNSPSKKSSSQQSSSQQSSSQQSSSQNSPEKSSKGSSEKTSDKISEIWKQIRISSLLRFFRASQPIHYSIFFTRIRRTPALASFSGGKLTYDDFLYIAENHPYSEELQVSLSFGLLTCLTFSKIRKFITEFYTKYPNLLYYISCLAPTKTIFGKKLFTFIESLHQFKPEDSKTAVNIVNFYLNNENLKGCLKFVPILKSSIAINPNAGSCLARICIVQKKYYEAMIYLNASGNSSNWPELPTSITSMRGMKMTEPINTIPCGPTSSEIHLFNSPLCSPITYYFSAIARLINRVGESQFIKMLDEFRASSRIRNRETFSTRFPPPEITIKSHTIQSSNIHNDVKNNSDQLKYLYDCGVEGDILEVDVLKKLPFSEFFSGVVNEVKNVLSIRKMVITGRVNKMNITQILSMGYRILDEKLIELAIKLIMKNMDELTQLDQILLMKIVSDGILTVNLTHDLAEELEEIIQKKNDPTTVSQKSALPLMKSLFKALHEKNNKCQPKKAESITPI